MVLAVLAMAVWGSSAVAAPAGDRLDLLTFQPATVEQWRQLHRSSDSPPITLSEVAKMREAGIGDAVLEEMVRTRRLVDRAAPDDLIRLKRAGAEDSLIAALSAHALPENRGVDLLLTVDVRSPHGLKTAPHLYVELWQSERDKKQDLAHADLGALMAEGRVLEDRSDPLLKQRFRRVRVRGRLRAPHPGPMELRVLVSHRPDLRSLRRLPANSAEAQGMKTWRFELPAVSLYDDCELDLGLARDPLIADRYALEAARWECTFE